MSAGISLTRRSSLTRLPVTAFSPASVAGMRLWFKADAITPVADGTDVSTWPDSSSGANNATFAGTKAKYYNGVVNGNPVVRWVAGDTRYSSAASAADASQSFFAVAQIADLTADRTLIGAAGNGAMALYVSTVGALRLIVQGVTVPGSSSSGAVSAGAFVVMSATVTSGAVAFWVNGTAQGTATGTYGAQTAQGAVLGAQNAGSVFKGDMAEIIKYSNVVSSSDRIAIHAYLGAKYGITMGGS